MSPERPIPLGDDIDMSQDAEPTPLLSRQLQEQRRPVPRRGPFVLDPLPCDGTQPQLRDKTLDLPGLLLLPRPPVMGGDGGNAADSAQSLDHLAAKPFDCRKHPPPVSSL